MRRITGISLCLAVVFSTGCGKETTSVSGEVTYNGVPIEIGYLSLSPVGKGRSVAAPINQGSYKIPDAQPGKYTAVATGSRKINYYSRSDDAYANAPKSGGHISEAADYIAPDAEGNSREIEIVAGDQQMDFAVTGAPMPK
jgi:hypothetical protein